MGYRCAPGVTSFDYIFWTHFYTYLMSQQESQIVPEYCIYMHSIENLILHLFTVHEYSNWA